MTDPTNPNLSAPVVCVNCGRPEAEHPRGPRFAFCPSEYNNGDDDMTFCGPDAPSGPDLSEGVRARVEVAWEEVRERLNREHRENIISYRELKAGVNAAALIRDAALSTPSSALTSNAEERRTWFSYERPVDAQMSGQPSDQELDAATPAIRDQAFEEAAKVMCADCEMEIPLNSRGLHESATGTRRCKADPIRALKGTLTGEEP